MPERIRVRRLFDHHYGIFYGVHRGTITPLDGLFTVNFPGHSFDNLYLNLGEALRILTEKTGIPAILAPKKGDYLRNSEKEPCPLWWDVNGHRRILRVCMKPHLPLAMILGAVEGKNDGRWIWWSKQYDRRNAFSSFESLKIRGDALSEFGAMAEVEKCWPILEKL